ncbi:hypothetical protein BDP27DRAFT_1056476 [Rhodocollybia butyracea]|uniref:Uncharacterized protein n=1 Tax=Rhodocollybia butyracea TaxID=206335 RepID=A0A9P5PIK2_9AGAR|nr:hypothetical protein BDP27DRAFT_1056476 [Rhodocollybia butyracea]
MSNLGNVEILKRRALSGKPGSIEALKQLCSMAEAANSRLFVDVFPVFQKFLSHNKPPVTGTPSTDIPLEALSILWCVGIGVEPMGSRSFNRNNDQILAAAVRKQWQDIINWSSFLFKNYVEPDLYSYEDLSDLGLEVLQKLLFLFGTIFSHPIIGPTELRSTPGAADLIVRIAMYALVVRVPAPESIPNGHRLRASEYSSRIFDELLGVPHWESFWGKEYVQSLNDFVTPRFCAIIAKVLVYLCQEKNLNYNLISNWLRVVSCAASRCMVLTHQLMFHRAVYFTTHILRRVSKVISRNPEAAKDLDVLKTWRWAMDYLSSSFAHGGYDCITLAVNSGLLSALWVLSQAAADTPGWQDYFTADELYVRIMGRLTSASLYRSVQKCLERHIDKLPLCDLHLDAPPGSPLELWVTLKQLLRSRHLLRIKVEFTQLGGVVTFCSNDKAHVSSNRGHIQGPTVCRMSNNILLQSLVSKTTLEPRPSCRMSSTRKGIPRWSTSYRRRARSQNMPCYNRGRAVAYEG